MKKKNSTEAFEGLATGLDQDNKDLDASDKIQNSSFKIGNYVPDPNSKPLRVSKMKLSPAGELKILFSKPIRPLALKNR